MRAWVRLFVFIISLFILVPTFYIEYQQASKQQKEHLENVLNTQTYHFEKWSQERSADIETLANIDIVKNHEYEKAKEFFDYFLTQKTDFADLVFINKEGFVQFDTVRPQVYDSLKIDVRNREYFQVAKNKKEGHITDVLISKVTHQPVVIFASPIIGDDQTFNGVVFGSVDLHTIDQFLSGSKVGDIGHTYVVNKDGILLTELMDHPSEAFGDHFTMDPSILKHVRDSVGPSPLLYQDPQGNWVFGAIQPMNQGNWWMISEIRVMDSFLPFLRKIAVLGLCILLGTFVATRFMIYIARQIEQPIQQLLQGVRYMESGDYTYKITESNITASTQEFRELFSAFNRMSDKVKENIYLLEELSTTCQLTNIYNRRYLTEYGDKIFRECVETGRACSCIAVDIDYFKQVNDTYGHGVGDQVLTHVSSILSSCIRSSDIVTRYGGEEFIILSPYTTLQQSLMIAERIREQVEANPFYYGDIRIPITISLGVAEYSINHDANTLPELIQLSDKALYQAKENGRNQTRPYDENGAAYAFSF
ncbi:GGDEF domain-containing protein [Ammoniphilus sp. CFH 90114]|uniref:sensor domain-containing diguanylate cyclase n=1 Tax=Ammoniphilus sp. CFH 90114 TaxID=2493665 RepID=UPI0013E978D1|nr:GGDEF domain-containing protein [Ammoniphilus sp. CFH 90114]